MTDRAEFEKARQIGLERRQEQRLARHNPPDECMCTICRAAVARRAEDPMYTAAEVKVLTEAALRLGRKEMAEELAKAFEERRPLPGWGVFSRQADITTAARMIRLYARDLLPLPSPDATSGRTDPEEPK